MNNEHREQAREIVDSFAQLLYSSSLTDVEVSYDHLKNRIASALSSRDTEIRKVLASLQRRENCWCEWKDGHAGYCQITTALYAKLQPREASDGTE